MSKPMRTALIIFLVGALALVGSYMIGVFLNGNIGQPPIISTPPIGGQKPPTDPPIQRPVADPADFQFTLAVEWLSPTLVGFSGTADIPDVSLALVTGDKVLARADAQVKAGRYYGSIEVPADRAKDLRLMASDPEQGIRLGQVQLNREIPEGTLYNTNFRALDVQRSGTKQLIIEGNARAFEAAFLVEVRQGDRPVAQIPVQAAEGAPAYGHFRKSITLDEPVGAGFEIWYIIASAMDGSLKVEMVQGVE